MKFEEAIKLLNVGKNVRLPHWGKENYIYSRCNSTTILHSDKSAWECCLDYFNSDNWEEYVEEDTWKLGDGKCTRGDCKVQYCQSDIRDLKDKILEDIEVMDRSVEYSVEQQSAITMFKEKVIEILSKRWGF